VSLRPLTLTPTLALTPALALALAVALTLTRCPFDSWLLATNNKENMLQWAASLHAAEPDKKKAVNRAALDVILAQACIGRYREM